MKEFHKKKNLDLPYALRNQIKWRTIKSIEERNKRLVEELAELVTKESYFYEQLKNTLQE